MESKILICDFETTVYKGQTSTEVWASACVELWTEDVHIFNSIEAQYTYFLSLDCNIIAYYHNLKFDGSFWLSYLLCDLHMKQAIVDLDDTGYHKEWIPVKEMENNTVQYSISLKGMWYGITIKVNNHIIEMRDSLKLLPFSVRRIGIAFNTKHKKLEMEYEGKRYAGCTITDAEKEYIANDVLVVKEALEIIFEQGHTGLTIGSCCLREFKKCYDKQDWENFFPNLSTIELEPEYKYRTADEYIRKSYKGGWCYLVRGKENQLKYNGTTADVNSLYPSMMSSESGNRYPVGKPYFWKGNYIPEEATKPNRYFFIRIRTRFYIKENYLPFIQIKGTYLYDGTEALETSDIWDKNQQKYCRYYQDKDGNITDSVVELTLTMTDYYLALEHYEFVDFEILDGCWFFTDIGIFDEYIEKYKKIKVTSKGALRELAKLFLNNLYGKMATSDDSSFKVAYEKEDGSLGFTPIVEHNKKTVYIAIGSAITSYAREFTIRAAQKNYHGVNERGFVYADTDSIHCDLEPQEIVGIKTDDNNFCCWKLESCWDVGYFVRQKTYVEHVVKENLQDVEPFYNLKCAGLPEASKKYFIRSMSSEKFTDEQIEAMTTEEKKFFFDKNGKQIVRDITDFHDGINIPGKLLPKRIKGGILLVDAPYKMRK